MDRRTTLVAWALALSLGACGDDPPAPTPPTATPPAPVSPRPKTYQITMILVRYRTPGVEDVARTHDDAKRLATRLTDEIRAGASMESLLRYTDDLGDDGRPFNGGSYSLRAGDPKVNAGLLALIETLEPGALAKEPYDSGLGFLVVRRDR
jgi:hypothetical protein